MSPGGMAVWDLGDDHGLIDSRREVSPFGRVAVDGNFGERLDTSQTYL
jgi:hypothetical protein